MGTGDKAAQGLLGAPASASRRLAGRILDSVVLAMVHLALYAVGVSGWLTVVLGGVAAIAYETILVTLTGQTLGKQAADIVVVTTDGSPATARHALIRAMAYNAPTVVARAMGVTALASSFSTIVALTVLIAPHRGVHDYLAGTKVVPFVDSEPQHPTDVSYQPSP